MYMYIYIYIYVLLQILRDTTFILPTTFTFEIYIITWNNGSL